MPIAPSPPFRHGPGLARGPCRPRPWAAAAPWLRPASRAVSTSESQLGTAVERRDAAAASPVDLQGRFNVPVALRCARRARHRRHAWISASQALPGAGCRCPLRFDRSPCAKSESALGRSRKRRGKGSLAAGLSGGPGPPSPPPPALVQLWHCGHQWLLRPAIRSRSMVAWQRRHGCPVRRYTQAMPP